MTVSIVEHSACCLEHSVKAEYVGFSAATDVLSSSLTNATVHTQAYPCFVD